MNLLMHNEHSVWTTCESYQLDGMVLRDDGTTARSAFTIPTQTQLATSPSAAPTWIRTPCMLYEPPLNNTENAGIHHWQEQH